MMYRLITLSGPTKGQRVTIEQKPMTLGRDPDCAVVVQDDEVSRKHAVLEHRTDGLFIRDLESMNKILVNKREVRESRLKHGDVIEIGRTSFLVQALVQAEISETDTGHTRARNATTVIIVTALLLAAAGFVGYTFYKKVRVELATPVPTKPAPQPKAAPATTETARAKAAPKPEAKPEAPKTNAPPPAAPSPSTLPPPETAAVSQELRQMRKDLTDIKDTIKDLAQKQPAPAPAEPAEQTADTTPAPEKPAPAKPEAPVDLSHILKIASLDQQKFPASAHFDEMRILHIGLKPATPGFSIDPEAVLVEVSFFDEDQRTKQIVPSLALTPKEPLKPKEGWKAGETKDITASYVVPKEARSLLPKGEQPDTFYGYIVRVYYSGQLQEETARPKNLLDLFQAEEPADVFETQPDPAAQTANPPEIP